jgi:hypothetical protein
LLPEILGGKRGQREGERVFLVVSPQSSGREKAKELFRFVCWREEAEKKEERKKKKKKKEEERTNHQTKVELKLKQERCASFSLLSILAL